MASRRNNHTVIHHGHAVHHFGVFICYYFLKLIFMCFRVDRYQDAVMLSIELGTDQKLAFVLNIQFLGL